MEENVQTPGQPGLFEEYEQFTDASQGSRFFNFLIDNLFMNYILSQATGYVVGYLLGVLAPDYMLSIAYEGESSSSLLFLSFCIIYFNYIFYYTICEAAFKGYTLGKLITGTRAIRADGQNLTFKNALLRTLSRIVPFEAFSGLGAPCEPWHDKWTKTRVIKAR